MSTKVEARMRRMQQEANAPLQMRVVKVGDKVQFQFSQRIGMVQFSADRALAFADEVQRVAMSCKTTIILPPVPMPPIEKPGD